MAGDPRPKNFTERPPGRRRIPRQSSRKAREQRELAKLGREAAIRDGHRCLAHGLAPGSCWGDLVPHHRIQKSVRPDLILELANLLTICVGHHRWIHDHEDTRAVPNAYSLDLLRESWQWP